MVLNDYIEHIKKAVSKALMDEWRAQGHYMTGKAVTEIKYVVEQSTEGFAIKGYMPFHGAIMDQGVPASKIPFAPGSGAKRSLYIEALTSYARQRMNISNMQEAKSVAFAIAHTQKREGMPTKGSYRFSSTGQRKGWIDEAFKKNRELIGEQVRRLYLHIIEIGLENVLNKHKPKE